MADPVFDIVTASGGNGISNVVAGGTLTFQYPPARGPATYPGQNPAMLSVRALQGIYVQDRDFTVVYGPTQITVTWLASATIPAGAVVNLQVPVLDTSDSYDQQVIVTPSGADAQYITQFLVPSSTSTDVDPMPAAGL